MIGCIFTAIGEQFPRMGEGGRENLAELLT